MEANNIWLDIRNRRIIWPNKQLVDGNSLIRKLVIDRKSLLKKPVNLNYQKDAV